MSYFGYGNYDLAGYKDESGDGKGRKKASGHLCCSGHGNGFYEPNVLYGHEDGMGRRGTRSDDDGNGWGYWNDYGYGCKYNIKEEE